MKSKMVSAEPKKKYCLFFYILLFFSLHFNAQETKLDTLAKTNPEEVLNTWEEEYDNATTNFQKTQILFPLITANINAGNTDEAKKVLEKIPALAESITDFDQRFNTYGRLCYFYGSQRTFFDYNKYVGKLEAMIKTVKDPALHQYYKTSLLVIKGNALYTVDINDSIRNLEYFVEEFDKNTPENKKKFLGDLFSSHMYIGFYNQKDDFKKTKEHYKKCIELHKKYNVGDISYTYLYLGNLAIIEEKYPEALGLIKKADSTYINSDENDKLGIYRHYAAIYKELGDSANAKKYHALENSLLKNFADKDKERRDNRLAESKEKKDLLIVLSVISLVLIVLLYFYIRSHKRKELKHKILYSKYIEEINHKNSEVERLKNHNSQTSLVQQSIPLDESGKALSSLTMSSLTKREILVKLNEFEETHQFLNKNITLQSLADTIKTNRQYLSEVIKKYKGKNFNAYINELRINYITQQIIDHKEYSHYKISYLASEAGYLSHSVFTVAFKNITGINPSQFIEQHKKAQKVKTER